MIFSENDHKEFFDDIAQQGFHIFGRRNAEVIGFYPNTFPEYPMLDISEIKDGDRITIRAFFPRSKSKRSHIDSGQIDLEVEYVDRKTKKVMGNILTELPSTFALSKNTTIELNLDEILYIQNR